MSINTKESLQERLDSRSTVQLLKEFAYIFGLERSGTKAEILERIINFVCHPEPDTKPIVAKTPSSSSSSSSTKKSQSKRSRDDDDNDESEPEKITPVKSSSVAKSAPTSTTTPLSPTNNAAAFALFSREESPLLIKIYPYLANKLIEKINILNNLWKALPDNEKLRFEQQAGGGNTTNATSGSTSLTSLSSGTKSAVKSTIGSASSTSKATKSESSSTKVPKKKKKVEKKPKTEKVTHTEKEKEVEEEEENDSENDNNDSESEKEDSHAMVQDTITTSSTKADNTITGVFDYDDNDFGIQNKKISSPVHNSTRITSSTSPHSLSSKPKSSPVQMHHSPVTNNHDDDDEGQLSDF